MKIESEHKVTVKVLVPARMRIDMQGGYMVITSTSEDNPLAAQIRINKLGMEIAKSVGLPEKG